MVEGVAAFARRVAGATVVVFPLFGTGDLVEGVAAVAGRVAVSAGVSGRALFVFAPAFFFLLRFLLLALSSYAFLSRRNASS